MSPSHVTAKMTVSLFIFLTVTLTSLCQCEQVNIEMNPGCTGKICDERKLAYSNYTSNETAYHYYYDVLKGSISTLIIQTKNQDNSSVGHINWNSLANPVNVSNGVVYNDSINAIGLVIGNLTLIEEAENKKTNYTLIPLTDFIIQTYIENKNNSEAIFSVNLSYFEPTYKEERFSIKLTMLAKAKSERHPYSPGLFYNPGSVHVEAIFAGPIPQSKNKTKISMPIDLLQFGKFEEKVQQTMDDEFSPGVFTIVTLEAQNDTNSNKTDKSFLQFRPVAYSNDDHMIVHTMDTILTNRNESINLTTTAVYGYFWNSITNHSKFDLKFDARDFYSKSNYTSFSFVLGLGEPTTEYVSTLVEVIIIIGFGVPSLALIIGIAYIAVKKTLANRSRRNLLQDENNE